MITLSQDARYAIALAICCLYMITMLIACWRVTFHHSPKFYIYLWLAKSRRWCNTPTGEKWVVRIGTSLLVILAVDVILLTTGLILS